MEWLVDQMRLMLPAVRAKGNGLVVIVATNGDVNCWHTLSRVNLAVRP